MRIYYAFMIVSSQKTRVQGLGWSGGHLTWQMDVLLFFSPARGDEPNGANVNFTGNDTFSSLSLSSSECPVKIWTGCHTSDSMLESFSYTCPLLPVNGRGGPRLSFAGGVWWFPMQNSAGKPMGLSKSPCCWDCCLMGT